MNTDLAKKANEANQTATEFSKLFYDHLDKKRHQLSRLYLDSAVATFDGNGTSGKEAIQKFYESLPASETVIASLDAQPMIDDATSNTILLMTSGITRLGNKQKSFQQTFVITAQGDKWKIVSDCFRIQDSLSTAALAK